MQFLPIFFFLCYWTIQANTRVLRVSTIEIPSFYQKKGESEEGFLVDLMNDLIGRVNNGSTEELTYKFQISPDNKFGKANDTFNGWAVMTEETEMGVAPMTITRERQDAVYVSTPFLSVALVPLVKKPAPGAPMPFTNLTDLLEKIESKELTLGYMKHGTTRAYLRNHKLPIIQKIYNASQSPDMESPYTDTYQTAIERVRQSGKYIYYGEHLGIMKAAQTNCDTHLMWGGMIGERHYGMIFPKTEAGWSEAGWELMEKFNDAIMAAEEDGTIQMLVWRYWYEKAVCPMPQVCRCNE